MILNFIFQAISLVGSVLYQRQRQKKMEAENDKRKGFDLTVDGQVNSVSIAYGPNKVAGTRTYREVFDDMTVKEGPSGSKTFQNSGSTTATLAGNSTPATLPYTASDFATVDSYNGSKKEILLVQQAICMEGIDSIVDVEVDGLSWDDEEFDKDQYITVYTDGGFPDPSASAMGVAETNRFTNCAWASMLFRLDREEYQYSGVPEVSFFIQGMKIAEIEEDNGVYTVSATKRYSTNPAEILLDYLTAEYGKNLPLSSLDLPSFYAAAQICNTETMASAEFGGRINGVRPVDEDETEPTPATKPVKLYEAGIVLDTERPFRENIELILNTMYNAELVWSEGVYKLSLSYPSNVTEQTNLITASYDEDSIVREEVKETWASALDRYNQYTISFRNESEDFGDDTATWPERYSTVHNTYLTEDNDVALTGRVYHPGITNPYQAAARAEQIVRASRTDKIYELTVGPRGQIHEPGDLISVSSPTLNITDEVMRVEKVAVQENFNVRLTANRFLYDNLAWNVSDDIAYSSRVIPRVRVSDVVNLDYTEGRREETNPIHGYLTWEAPLEGEVDYYQIDFSTDAGATFQRLSTTAELFYDIPVSFNDDVDFFRVIARGTNGRTSAGVTVVPDDILTLLPPSNLTNETRYNATRIFWEQPNEQIVSHWIVTEDNGTSITGSAIESVVSSKFFDFTFGPLDSNKNFWVRSVSDSGQESINIGPIAASPSKVPLSELGQDVSDAVDAAAASAAADVTAAQTAATAASASASASATSATNASASQTLATAAASDASGSASAALASTQVASRLLSGGANPYPTFDNWDGTGVPEGLLSVNTGTGSSSSFTNTFAAYNIALRLNGTTSSLDFRPSVFLSSDHESVGVANGDDIEAVIVTVELSKMTGTWGEPYLVTGWTAGSGGTSSNLGVSDRIYLAGLKAENGLKQTYEFYVEREDSYVAGSTDGYFDFRFYVNSDDASEKTDVSIAIHRLDYRVVEAESRASLVQKAVTDVNGFAEAHVGLIAETSGGQISGIKATSFDNPDGTGNSVLELIGREVIADGTLRAAQLEAGTITAASAVIGDLAVDTLQIAGNAVTEEASAFTQTGSALTSTPSTVISVALAREAGFTTRIEFSADVKGTLMTDGDLWELQTSIYRGATLLENVNRSLFVPSGNGATFFVGNTFLATVDSDTTGGTETYSVEMWATDLESGAVITPNNLAIILTQTKR